MKFGHFLRILAKAYFYSSFCSEDNTWELDTLDWYAIVSRWLFLVLITRSVKTSCSQFDKQVSEVLFACCHPCKRPGEDFACHVSRQKILIKRTHLFVCLWVHRRLYGWTVTLFAQVNTPLLGRHSHKGHCIKIKKTTKQMQVPPRPCLNETSLSLLRCWRSSVCSLLWEPDIPTFLNVRAMMSHFLFPDGRAKRSGD